MPKRTSSFPDDDSLLSPEVVERRTAIAKMRQLELGNEKDYITLEEKKSNICRIDSALDAFDDFLREFVDVLHSLPDRMQGFVPGMKPEEYAEIQSFIDAQIQRLGQKRLYLAIESTAEQMARATAAKEESIQKNQKIKKGARKNGR